MFKRFLTFAFAGLSLLSYAEKSESTYDKIWSYTKLVEAEDDRYLKLSGRLHADAAAFDSDQGSFEDLLWRRFRFGFSGRYDDIFGTLEADFNFNDGTDGSYNRLTDAYLGWDLSDDTSFKFLKHSAGFTMDGRTSSKKILTPQRNNLTNNLWFTSEYFTGVSMKQKVGDKWSWKGGVFSSDGDDEISVSDASFFVLLSLTRKLGKADLWDKGSVTLDYVFNDTHVNGATRSFSNVGSLSANFVKGKVGCATELAAGKGDLGQSDVWGVVVMPHLRQNKYLHWVLRYTYLESGRDNGVRLGRYESSIVGGRGDRYSELFAGINVLLYDHKLKFQLGVQHSDMQDAAADGGEYSGWGLTGALRMYW